MSFMLSAFQQIISTSGIQITWSTRNTNLSSRDAYGQPTTSYSSQTIWAKVAPVGDKELTFIEPGLVPGHYIKVYEAEVVPKHLDRVTYDNIVFEVRSVIPRHYQSQIVYYEVLARRLEDVQQQ